ncbi:T6SS immunity protein Tli3 family protein [Rahnella sp. PAMC 25559]|uniref:T6SS immunity protein Tli3 family protein n=1 Tax=Rahnella sp. PAMC 25559 TaxID=3423225 RepID=UPI003D67288F
MKVIHFVPTLTILYGICAFGQASALSTPPTQVVYRFDDHRFLELNGFNCEGGLTYTDTKKNIHSVIYENSDRYRVYTKTFIHPSERYIVIPEYEDQSTFTVSKDFGKTWEAARYSPGGGADPYGKRIPSRTDKSGVTYVAGEGNSPLYDDILSLTVVNDQGFILNKWGDIYMSSKPFDDQRLQPGGSGINYVYEGRKHHLNAQDNGTGNNSYWGKDYMSWASVQMPKPWKTFAYQTNFQGIPNKLPEVKNYNGWDKMRCNPDLGLPASEQGK